MLQFAIIARDGNDKDALNRRMQSRPAHLEGARILKEKGQLISGGALLDEDGQMRGSLMLVQFNTREEFEHWYATEPYRKDAVWQTLEVIPFREAVL